MENLKNQFSKKSYTVYWTEGGAVEKEVKIQMPDLSDSTISVWGDWGPMYKLCSNKGLTIKVTGEGRSSLIEKSSLEFLSPVLADQRRKTPFYCSIKDTNTERVFELYFDSSAELVEAEVSSCDSALSRPKLQSVSFGADG